MWRSYLSFLLIFLCEEIFFLHVKKQFSFSFSLRSNSASICFLVHSLQVVVESPVTSCQWQQTKINKRKFILFWFLRVSTQLLTNRWRHEILPLWTGDCLARNHNQNVHPNTKHLRLMIFGWDPVSNGMCVRKISSEHLYASHLAADADAK